jgi:hypothetical protein
MDICAATTETSFGFHPRRRGPKTGPKELKVGAGPTRRRAVEDSPPPIPQTSPDPTGSVQPGNSNLLHSTPTRLAVQISSPALPDVGQVDAGATLIPASALRPRSGQAPSTPLRAGPFGHGRNVRVYPERSRGAQGRLASGRCSRRLACPGLKCTPGTLAPT